MKMWITGAIMTLATVSGSACAGAIPGPTAAERRRSIETGICVVREDQDITGRMLLPEADPAVQSRFLALIRKCTSTGTKLFPNVVMGAAAEKMMVIRAFRVENLRTTEEMPKNFLDKAPNRFFACAITAKPASLTKMLRTNVGDPEELDSIENFRLALIECDNDQGRRVTPVNIRALAARNAFAMMKSAR